MNGILNSLPVPLQQALAWLGSQARALWNVASAIIANRPEPARNVVAYTLALAVLLAFAPKIIKLISK